MDINNNPVMVDADETITGHCSISLEQLCKVAVSGATTVSTTAVRILINRGRPMYNIDVNTYQVLTSSPHIYSCYLRVWYDVCFFTIRCCSERTGIILLQA
jgi:CRISPR/Cas system-associated endonuclease Cas1